jgi:hypothetical protein
MSPIYIRNLLDDVVGQGARYVGHLKSFLNYKAYVIVSSFFVRRRGSIVQQFYYFNSHKKLLDRESNS